MPRDLEKARTYAREYMRKRRLDPAYAGQKRYRNAHPEYLVKHRAWRFGVTVPELLALLASEPVCPICGRPTEVVDHDHSTNTVRGMLCHKCNRGIGFLNDDPALVQKALDYLKRMQ